MSVRQRWARLGWAFYAAVQRQESRLRRSEVLFIAYPGLAAWAKLWRASGASERGEAGEEAGEAWRGHGCPVPLQRQDAALAWARLSDAPTFIRKARKPVRLGAGTAVPCPTKAGCGLGLGALSDAPTIYSKSEEAVRLGAGTAVPCPYTVQGRASRSWRWAGGGFQMDTETARSCLRNFKASRRL